MSSLLIRIGFPLVGFAIGAFITYMTKRYQSNQNHCHQLDPPPARRPPNTGKCEICGNEEGNIISLSCGHKFHKYCVMIFWKFDEKKTCPICRKENLK